MNKNQLVTFSALASFLLLSACGGGNGSHRTLGRQCPVSYNPVSMNVPANQKISLDSPLPVGTFEYNGATLYYKDISNYRIELNDTKQKDSNQDKKQKDPKQPTTPTFKMTKGCIRNDSPKIVGLTFAIDGISKMVVQGNSNKVLSDVKSYSFSITDKEIVMTSTNADNKKPERPSDLYKGTAQESFLYQVDAENFEIRSTGKTQNGSEYFLAVKFIKK